MSTSIRKLAERIEHYQRSAVLDASGQQVASLIDNLAKILVQMCEALGVDIDCEDER